MSLKRALSNNTTMQTLRSTVYGNSLHTTNSLKNDNRRSSKNCDSGKCSRAQMDMKQYLEGKEMEHLQPGRAKFSLAQFKLSRPHVDSYVNPELEEICLQQKKCKDLQRGKSKKDR